MNFATTPGLAHAIFIVLALNLLHKLSKTAKSAFNKPKKGGKFALA